MQMLLQCYPPPPPGLFVPAGHRLAAAVCLVCVTRFLLLLAVKLRPRLGVYLEGMWTSALSTTKLFGTKPEIACDSRALTTYLLRRHSGSRHSRAAAAGLRVRANRERRRHQPRSVLAGARRWSHLAACSASQILRCEVIVPNEKLRVGTDGSSMGTVRWAV